MSPKKEEEESTKWFKWNQQLGRKMEAWSGRTGRRNWQYNPHLWLIHFLSAPSKRQQDQNVSQLSFIIALLTPAQTSLAQQRRHGGAAPVDSATQRPPWFHLHPLFCMLQFNHVSLNTNKGESRLLFLIFPHHSSTAVPWVSTAILCVNIVAGIYAHSFSLFVCMPSR